jgi:hypothetical protein
MTDNHPQIGRKIVLHSVPFPARENVEEDEFFLVTIVEVKTGVPGCWDRKNTYEGLRAVDENGKSYFSTWDSFPDDSMTPRWLWNTEDGESWYDVTQGIFEPIPFRPAFLNRPGFSEVVHYCEKHQTLNEVERSQVFVEFAKSQGFSDPPMCFQCLAKKPSVSLNGWKGYGWRGWR